MDKTFGLQETIDLFLSDYGAQPGDYFIIRTFAHPETGEIGQSVAHIPAQAFEQEAAVADGNLIFLVETLKEAAEHAIKNAPRPSE